MDQVSLGVAFVAGLISFLAPCILPLVPGYISFLSGVSIEELKQGSAHKKVIMKAGFTAVFFVLGFSIVFMALGASASLVGKLLLTHIRIFTKISGVLIVVLGLYLIGILKIKALDSQKQLHLKKRSPGFLSAMLIGAAFAFGWSPCIGPILAGILAIAATKETLLQGVVLLGVYSLGLGIPFIITGFAIGLFMKFFEKYKRFIKWFEIVAGVFLIIIGVLIFTDKLTVLLKFVPPVFYEFAK